MAKRMKQGQSRWTAILYLPGKLEGYDDCAVALVERCFVTKVKGNAVYYDHGGFPYLCGCDFFVKTSYPTFRQAYRAAQKLIESFMVEDAAKA